jgi:hypothetical protein
VTLGLMKHWYWNLSVVDPEEEVPMKPQISSWPRILSILLLALPFAPPGLGQQGFLGRWAAAVGGREKMAAVQSTYREATIQVAGVEGTIKAWHTSDGKYRKEQRIGSSSVVEVFDGINGTVQRGTGPIQKMSETEVRRAISTAYEDWNSVFFAFFPERRRGNLDVASDGTIVLQPNGGIEWRVTLDPKTSLPKVMVHKEGDRTVTDTFVSYETVDGVPFEKEIRRTSGDPKFDAVIRFTNTVINPPEDASLFSVGLGK